MTERPDGLALQLEPEKPEYQDHMDRYRKAAGG